MHPFWEKGSPPIPTPSVSAYWQGWDITRGITNNGFGSGWVVDGWGGVHPFGGAPDLGGSGYWKGWDIVRGISFVFSLQSGYYADGWGGVHPFGAGAPVPDVSGYWPHWDIVRGVSGGP